jgi:hypothetical protein
MVVATLALAKSANAAPIVSIEATTPKAVGDTFTLEVRIADAVALAGYGFSLAFDSNVLKVLSVEDEIGTLFVGSDEDPYFPHSTDVDNTAGTVKEIAALLAQPVLGVSGGGMLALVTFSALAPGTSFVTPYFDSTALVDQMYDANFIAIQPSFLSGEVVVKEAVPEPTSVLMLALGLGTILGRRRRLVRPLNKHRAAAI